MAISIKQIVVVIGFFERSGLLCVQETPVGGQNSDTLSGRKVVPQLVIFATRKNAAPTVAAIATSLAHRLANSAVLDRWVLLSSGGFCDMQWRSKPVLEQNSKMYR
jgi:hypothetical protein